MEKNFIMKKYEQESGGQSVDDSYSEMVKNGSVDCNWNQGYINWLEAKAEDCYRIMRLNEAQLSIEEKFMRETGGRAESFDDVYMPEYQREFLEWLKVKAASYDQLKQTPNLPHEYKVFLVYFQKNQGDFKKTVHALTYDSRCSLEVMEWFASILGISWEKE